MKKRVLVMCLILCLLGTLVPQGVLAAKDQTVETLQSLLMGIRFDPEAPEKVSHWDDELILQALYGKLMWTTEEEDLSYLKRTGLEAQTTEDGEIRYDAALVLELAVEAYGRGYSKEAQLEEKLRLEEEGAILTPSEEDREVLYIHEYRQLADAMVATGMAVSYGSTQTLVKGYFRAVFKRNAASVYGYTLVSLKDISSDHLKTDLTANASTELKGESKVYYAENAVDGDLKTAWMEGVSGVGKNEWIRVDSGDGSPMTIHALELDLGYHKSEKNLKRNGWPTKLKIQAEGGYEQTVEFQEYQNAVIFDEPITTGWVRLTILDAEAGTDYEDTCISEIRLGCVDVEGVFQAYQQEAFKDPSNPGKIEILFCGEVTVTRKPGFEKDAVLEAPMLTGAAAQKVLNSFAEGELENYAIYELSVTPEEEGEFKRVLEIRLPVPDKEQEQGWMVYRVHDGGHTRVQFECADGFVTLQTRELGCYVVGHLKNSNVTQTVTETDWTSGLTTVLWWGAGIVAVVVAVSILSAVIRRKEDQALEEEE